MPIIVWLTILSVSFGRAEASERPVRFDHKNSGHFEQILRQDVATLAELEFSNYSPLFRLTFGIEKGSVWSYFRERIDRFEFSNSAIKENLASYQPPKKLVVTPGYFAQSQAVRLSVLIHEAAHRDSSHIECPSPYIFRMSPGPNSKEDLVVRLPSLVGPHCDQDLSGAYAKQYVFLFALVNDCSNCSEAEKYDASTFLAITLSRISDPQAAFILWRDSFATAAPNRGRNKELK